MAESPKFYLTREGLEKLKKEYQELKKAKRAKLKNETPSIVPSQGIDSEYLTFQEDLNFLDSRIEELENILRNHQLIKPPPKKERQIINLGATVLVEVEGQIDELTIVGSVEANPTIGKISNESPVGKALLGHKIGDEVKVQSTIATIYKIKKIEYRL
jgi:transcription elongation factor GreA